MFSDGIARRRIGSRIDRGEEKKEGVFEGGRSLEIHKSDDSRSESVTRQSHSA